MTRCDYDAVFYRVFCITLLAIAFTFTIVLTNVFIDIDGLLARKQGHPRAPIIPNNNDSPEELTPDPVNNDEASYGDTYDSYRTKRSIETQNFLFHIKNPQIKNILTNRLSHLLEALDGEETHAKNAPKEYKERIITALDDSKDDEEKQKKQRDEDILHLTMHNILLQGIIGHMNMNDVYKRVNTLMNNFNKQVDKSPGSRATLEPVFRWFQHEWAGSTGVVLPKIDVKKQYCYCCVLFVKKNTALVPIFKAKVNDIKTTNKTDKNKVLVNFLKCHERRDHKEPTENHTTVTPIPGTTPEVTEKYNERDRPEEKNSTNNYRIGSNILINSLIDIKHVVRSKNDTTPTDNVHGTIELHYNGKVYKFTRQDAETNHTIEKKTSYNIIRPKNSTFQRPPEIKTRSDIVKIDYNEFKKIPKDYLNQFVAEYFKHFPSIIQEATMHPKELNETRKRIKRFIKVRDKYRTKSHKKKQRPDDDDLYVEIETHYNKKDSKAGQKQKLIKNLIEKIQNAINSNDTKQIDNASKQKRTKIWRIRKRQQNPLANDTQVLIQKVNIPVAPVIHRQVDPITIHKTIPKQEGSISVHDKRGNAWKKEVIGPAFLAATKAINSAEMSELDVDYKTVMNTNGIPQRLQKPLNTDMSPETMNPYPYSDYVLENMLLPFSQLSDQDPNSNWENNNWNGPNYDEKPHNINRRSILNADHIHSNEYKSVFNGSALTYNHYKDILRSKLSIPQVNIPKLIFFNNDEQLLLDDNILDKDLQPAEIFGLANMFNRKKRTLSVKRISNIKSQRRINRYLNTKKMSSRNQQFHKRRNKRQINKIRIIASDIPHKHNSDENIFVVAEDENIFADRAIVKEEKTDVDHEVEENGGYNGEIQDDAGTFRLFDSKSRHNALMSKYPHVFMEEITRSREDVEPEATFLLRKVPGASKYEEGSTMELEKIDNQSRPTDEDSTIHADLEVQHTTEHIDLEQKEIVKETPDGKAKLKVTVKISPKNATNVNLNSDFKEVYATINKRFNKNGLQYLSLLNVSEISEIQNMNKTKDQKDDNLSNVDSSYLARSINDQEDKMQMLLREHQKNIDEQLNRLNEEKFKLESILTDDNNTVTPRCDYLDGVLKLKTLKNTNAAEGTEMVTPATLKTESTTLTPMTTTTIPTTLPTTILTTTTELSTTHSTTIITHPVAFINDNLKKKILHTIERNENLTDQILKKIDKNSEILEIFLKRFTEKENTRLPEHKPVYKEEEKNDIPMTNKIEPLNNYPNDWRPHLPPLKFNDFNSNYYLRPNGSHVPIPFVYAFPPSIIKQAHSMNSALGNVYHGHIHQSLHVTPLKETIITHPKTIEANNQTRFFLDDMESDYKVIPMHDIKLYNLHKNTTGML